MDSRHSEVYLHPVLFVLQLSGEGSGENLTGVGDERLGILDRGYYHGLHERVF